MAATGFLATVEGLFSGIAKSAGTAAAKAAAADPTVQNILTDVEERLDRAETGARVAAAIAAGVVLFYFVPRFENPIPRIFRKSKTRR